MHTITRRQEEVPPVVYFMRLLRNDLTVEEYDHTTTDFVHWVRDQWRALTPPEQTEWALLARDTLGVQYMDVP